MIAKPVRVPEHRGHDILVEPVRVPMIGNHFRMLLEDVQQFREMSKIHAYRRDQKNRAQTNKQQSSQWFETMCHVLSRGHSEGSLACIILPGGIVGHI